MKLNKVKFAMVQAEKELNINTIAEKSGVSRNTVTSAKHGKSCFPATCKCIASALGVDVKDILEEE